jgi:hypothetical protein
MPQDGAPDGEQPTDRPEIRLAGVPLGRSRHICALFHDRDEQFEVLLPFLRQGLEDGDKALQIIDGRLRADNAARLQRGGVDVAAAEGKGQLEVKTWDEAYLRGGRFDQHLMLAYLEGLLQQGKAEGYRLTRLFGEMEWALEDLPGVGDLREYEARLNYILPLYDDAVT